MVTGRNDDKVRFAFLPTVEDLVIPAFLSPVAPRRKGSGYRVSESFPRRAAVNGRFARPQSWALRQPRVLALTRKPQG